MSISSIDGSSSSIREDIEHVILKDRSGSVGEESLLVLWRNTGVFLEFEYSPLLSFTGILDSCRYNLVLKNISIGGE